MSLLARFKVIRCPIDDQVLRARAFEKHMKKRHKTHPYQESWTRRAKTENSCLICNAHAQPQIELMARSRRGNDHFIEKHANHLPNKLTPLTELEKEAVRQVLDAVNNVDLDATPLPPPPQNISF